jgi:hypothetical protein
MFEMRLLGRMLQIGACAAVLLAWVRPSYSAPAACVAAWRNADELAKAGQLRLAKTTMLKCAHHTCGGTLHKECSRRVAEIEGDIPTVVPVVKDANGDPVTEVDMLMDGELLASRIDGRAVVVDPGTHEFTFQTPRGLIASYRTVILQGQRNRSLEVTLRPGRAMVKTRVPSGALVAATMSDDSPSARGTRGGRGGAENPELNLVPEADDEPLRGGRRITTGSVAMAGLGVLGVAGFSLANYQGNKENRALNSCSPNCTPESVDRVRKIYQYGRISLGVGVAALAGAALLYLTSSPSRSAEMAAASGYWLDVQPTASGGGYAALSGSF